MKVLYLLPPAEKAGRIGAYGFLDEELIALARRGVRPYVISPCVDEPSEIDGVRIVPLPAGRNLIEGFKTSGFLLRRSATIPRQAWKPFRSLVHATRIERFAAAFIEENGIQLVHSHFGWPRGSGGFHAAQQAGVSLVASFRGMDLFLEPSISYGLRRDPAYDASLRELLRTADRTVYWGESTRTIGLSLGADPARSVVLRKGVDIRRFRVAADREALLGELGYSPPVLFLAATSLIPRKGVDTALHALAQLRDTHLFTFIVCGDGPDRPSLEALAARLGLSDRVRFVGRLGRDEIARYFAACDVYLLASVVEAAGNVVLEAMASGRPVICTDSGGPPEYVEDGVTGLVVPPSDPGAMAGAVRRLLDDPQLRESLGRAARKKAESELSYAQMLDRIVEMYEELIVGGRGIRQTSSISSTLEVAK